MQWITLAGIPPVTDDSVLSFNKTGVDTVTYRMPSYASTLAPKTLPDNVIYNEDIS